MNYYDLFPDGGVGPDAGVGAGGGDPLTEGGDISEDLGNQPPDEED